MPETMYSIKMRASRAGAHISGAERIVPAGFVSQISEHLHARALGHPKGHPDSIVVTTTALAKDDIIYLPELAVSELPCASPHQARALVTDLLAEVTPHSEVIWNYLQTVTGLRGAMVIDSATGQRIEPDKQRGVRASTMDHRSSLSLAAATEPDSKNYVREARVLAAKVASCPHVLAEVCISDDPDYTTGYVCIRGRYHRIANMKLAGTDQGTRVIVVSRADQEALAEISAYLENQAVIVG
ncbi:6-carboxyhexanoate--CoA ligase [Corynebacterium pseudodiphtheriticum]|uniref:6-carboxyhexanoate--CoA ligase n=1 Tax=Corynebacterium pseudodiphtheriticum TaxID=37637 RepID=UPI00254B6E81|nr:6-carboxyhexanoate--CoA ligase [Corynebacterium pseudodiphtheriticum]MDK8683269.1 6-carboxyhexanoate--CoA ligase [Corynebacterium pseudodiphtheriticum]